MSEGIDIVAELMAVSGKNAPTALDKSYLDISLLDEAEKEMLVEEMFQLADELDDESYAEKGDLIEKCQRVILVGLGDHPSLGIDCKACGYDDCKSFDSAKKKEDIFEGPNCVFRLIDLGLAIGYILRTCRQNNVFSEILIKGGLAAKSLGLSDCNICLAIPIYEKSRYSYFRL
ncbi:MAG: DUF2148 domain-containing protein [Thermoplasmatota archaeon]